MSKKMYYTLSGKRYRFAARNERKALSLAAQLITIVVFVIVVLVAIGGLVTLFESNNKVTGSAAVCNFERNSGSTVPAIWCR